MQFTTINLILQQQHQELTGTRATSTYIEKYANIFISYSKRKLLHTNASHDLGKLQHQITHSPIHY